MNIDEKNVIISNHEIRKVTFFNQKIISYVDILFYPRNHWCNYFDDPSADTAQRYGEKNG